MDRRTVAVEEGGTTSPGCYQTRPSQEKQLFALPSKYGCACSGPKHPAHVHRTSSICPGVPSRRQSRPHFGPKNPFFAPFTPPGTPYSNSSVIAVNSTMRHLNSPILESIKRLHVRPTLHLLRADGHSEIRSQLPVLATAVR